MSNAPDSLFLRWLKKYRYLNIALIYLGTALVVIHFTEAIVHGLHMPALTFSLVVVIALAGLPIVLLIAWAMGVQKEESPGNNNSRVLKKRKWGRVVFASVISMILFASSIFLYARYFNKPGISVKERSVAVLPFKNISVNKEENEPFCTGVTLELQKNLGWMHELLTIAPQSMEKFRDTRLTTKEIANELAVQYLVSGSVLRDKDQVKVFATLVDAVTGRQVWTDDFRGEMVNIFSLQEEIAQKIAEALRVNISPEEQNRIARVVTTNAKALDAFYDAQVKFVNYSYAIAPPSSAYEQIQALCNRALDLDSNIAEAYVIKANAYWRARYREEYLKPTFMDSVLFFCRKALTIDPNAVDAMVLLGDYYSHVGNKELALDYLEKALHLKPNHYYSNWAMGKAGMNLYYDPVRSIRYLRKTIALDPLSVWTPAVYNDLSLAYLNICDFEKAIEMANKVLAQKENTTANTQALWTLTVIYNRKAEADKAIEYGYKWFRADSTGSALYHIAEVYCIHKKDWVKGLEIYNEFWRRLALQSRDISNTHRLALALWKTGQKEKAMKLFNNAIQYYKKADSLGRFRFGGYDMAGIHAFLGNKTEAYRLLNASAKNEHWAWGMPYLIQIDPLFDNLRNDPEFKTIVKEALEEKAKLRQQVEEEEKRAKL